MLDGNVRVLHQIREEAEFNRGESNFFARFSQRVAMGVQFQIANPEDNPFGQMRAEPARDRPQSREEFPDAEGLRNIVVRTGLERVYFVLLAVADGDHHYSGQREDGTKTPARLYTTHPRHLNIEEYQIGPAPAGAFDCLFS